MFIKGIIKSDFFKKVSITSAGIFIAYFINLFLQPLITRIFSPEMIGSLSLIITIIGFLEVISSFGYDRAILPADNNEEATQLFIIAFFLLIVFTILVIIMLFFSSKYLSLLENINYWFFIPALLFTKGVIKISQRFLVKFGNFTQNSIGEIMRIIFPNSLKVLFGKYIDANVLVLLVASLLGSVLSVIYLVSQSARKLNVELKIHSLKRILIKYKKYPLILNWNSIVNAFAQHSIVILLAWFYSTKDVGFFSLAQGISILPVMLISNSIFQVFLPRISDKKNKKKPIKEEFRKVTFYLIIIGFIGFFFFYNIAPWLFETFFGYEWRVSGIYSQILIPWIFMIFISKPANSIVQLFQSFKFLSIYNLSILFLRILAVSIGFYIFHDVLWSLALFSIVGFLGNLFFLFHANSVVGIYDESI